jgi:hypothetical protein
VLLQEQPLPLGSFRAFSDQARSQQNWLMVWKSELLLCQLTPNTQLKQRACDRAHYAVNLLPDNQDYRFKTALTRYLHRLDDQALTQARLLASSNTQKAALWLAEGKIPSQTLIASIKANSIQQAQLFYLTGKDNSDLSQLTQAVALFKQNHQMHRAADSLFLLSQLHFEAGDTNSARKCASESLLILDGLNSKTAFQRVKDWFDDRLSTR